MPTLQQALVARLAASGLTLAHAKALGITALTEAQCEKLRAKCKATWPIGEMLHIPYHNLRAKQTAFWRTRYFDPPNAGGFAAATGARPLRYVQAPNTVNEVYLPPLIDWAAIAADTRERVIITEGELKAAAGCVKGLNVMALGGVEMFGAPKKGLSMYPIFDEFEWGGRDVLIVYDSDVSTNPRVAIALNKLAHAMTMRGAEVYCGTMPPGPEGAKQGLDDYLLTHDADQFEKDVALSATHSAECIALHEMNELIYVVNDPLVYAVETVGNGPDTIYDLHKLKQRFATKFFVQVTTKDDGKVVSKPVSTIEAWLKWPYRRAYQEFVYEPGKSREIGANRNRWKGWGCDPVKGDIAPFLALLSQLFEHSEPEARAYGEKLLAFPVQKPGEQLNVAMVMYGGEEGTGKSMLGVTMGKIYGSNYEKISEAQLTGSFNAWHVDKQFIMGEEISSGDMRPAQFNDMLKDLITQDYITINRKYMEPFRIKNCVAWYFPTNHRDAFTMGDSNRRMFVIEVKNKAKSEQFYVDYGNWLDNGGAEAVHHYLRYEVNLKGFNPKAPAMMTKAKARMMQAGYTDAIAWAKEILVQPEVFYKKQALHKGEPYAFDLWPIEDLHMAYPYKDKIQRKVFIKEMQNAGMKFACDEGQITLPDGSTKQLFVVRNPEKWISARVADAKAHMAGREGAIRAPKAATAKGRKK